MRRGTFAAVLLLAVVAAGCGEQQPGVGASPEARPVACTGDRAELVTPGTLTVGSDIAYAPFEFVNQQTQRPEGFDVDLLTEVGKRLNLKTEFRNQAFDGIIPGLLARKYDAIASSMTITEERRAQVCFSDPYFDANQSLIVNVKRTPDLKNTSELEGKVVGAQQATTGLDWARENLQGKAKEIREYETIDDAFLDLKSGKLDGIITDIPVGLYRSKLDPDFKVVEEIKTNEQYGIAVDPKNKGLLDDINNALSQIRDDGTYDAIYEKWFGQKPSS